MGKNIKIIFIDGIDRSGKSTMITKLNAEVNDSLEHSCRVLSLPTKRFRELELWKVVGEGDPNKWDKQFIHTWAGRITEDMAEGIISLSEDLIQNNTDQKKVILVDRGFISTIVYQLAMYLIYLDSKQNTGLNIKSWDISKLNRLSAIIKSLYTEWKETVISIVAKKRNEVRANGYDNFMTDMNYFVFTDQIKEQALKEEDKYNRNTSNSDNIFENEIGFLVKNIFRMIYKEDIPYYQTSIRDLSINKGIVSGVFSFIGSVSDELEADTFKDRFIENYNKVLRIIF